MLRQFFDSSALIKYYHNENGSAKVQILVSGSGSEHYVARLAWVEILSALAKKVRTGTIVPPDYRRLQPRLRADINRRLIRPLRMLNAHFEVAGELIGKYGLNRQLRTLDAIQLAVAPEPSSSLPDRPLRVFRPEALRDCCPGRTERHRPRTGLKRDDWSSFASHRGNRRTSHCLDSRTGSGSALTSRTTQRFPELFSDLPPLACTSFRGSSPTRAGFGPKFPQRCDHPFNPDHRFLAGKVLTDVCGCPVIPGGAIGEQGHQCGQGSGLFLGCGGNHGSRKKAGVDGFQDVMELLRIRAGDHGELANGGKLEVEGDQALAGGGRGVFKDDLDRIESRPPGAAEVVTTGQGAQPDQGGRGHCIA